MFLLPNWGSPILVDTSASCLFESCWAPSHYGSLAAGGQISCSSNPAGYSVSFIPSVIVVLSPHVSFSNALKRFSSLTSHMLHSLPRVKRYYITELYGDLWMHLPMQVRTSVGQRSNLGPLWTPPNTDIHSSVLKVKVNLYLAFLHKRN